MPVFSIIGSCSVAVFVALINFSETLRPKDVLDVLMNTTGMIALLVYLVIAISQLKMRRKLEAEGKPIRLKMWLFPWLTYLVIAFIVAALVTMAFMPDYQILVISTGIAAAVVVVMGVVHQIRSGSKQH
ncbi:GABA permease [compost metagenome]